ncbi:MAG: hypothetical protein H7Z14_08430 [Anaerolineae bacterium]|nr:hypothetical protein [Phycisphaerae bacterium]
MGILRPVLVALDSSAVGNLARDTHCAGTAEQVAAHAIREKFVNGSLIPILTLHQIGELVAHNDSAVVSERLALLSQLPHVAFVQSLKHKGHVGSIIDIGAAEVQAIYLERLRDPADIAEFAKLKFLAFDTGRRLVAQFEGVLPELKIRLAEMRQRDRAVSSLVHVDVFKNRHQSLRKAFQDVVGFRKDTIAAASEFARKLASELGAHADKKAGDPSRLAREFAQDMRPRFAKLARSEQPVLETLCAHYNVDVRAVSLDMSVEDFCWMGVFQRQLEILVETLGLPVRLTEHDVSSRMMPSWIVRREIFHARRAATRAAGSDLSDDYLAALACYADLTVVDKRTHAYLTQRISKCGPLRSCLRQFTKVRNTSDLAQQLSELA